MSMAVSIYIGPYLVIAKPSKYDLVAQKFEDVLCEGRGEFSMGDKVKILVPNCAVPGITRKARFNRYDDDPNVYGISATDIDAEILSFVEVSKQFTKWCSTNNIDFEFKWGIVPGMF